MLEFDANKNSLFVEQSLEDDDFEMAPFFNTQDRVAYVSDECRLVEKLLLKQ